MLLLLLLLLELKEYSLPVLYIIFLTFELKLEEATHQANLLFHHYSRQIIWLSPKSDERTMKTNDNTENSNVIIDNQKHQLVMFPVKWHYQNQQC